MTVPPPCTVTEPLPVTGVLMVILPVRLKMRPLLSTTLPVPRDPVEPPLPICSVPWLMVVVPDCELVPVKIQVPTPVFVTAVGPPLSASAVASVSPAVSMPANVSVRGPAPLKATGPELVRLNVPDSTSIVPPDRASVHQRPMLSVSHHLGVGLEA